MEGAFCPVVNAGNALGVLLAMVMGAKPAGAGAVAALSDCSIVAVFGAVLKSLCPIYTRSGVPATLVAVVAWTQG